LFQIFAFFATRILLNKKGDHFCEIGGGWLRPR
jgi:hypothetical protein